MTRLLRSLAVGGLLTFCVVGFMDTLPWAIQMPLWLIAIAGSALTGGNVHIGSFTFLIASLLVAFTVAAFPFVRFFRGREVAGGWTRRALQAAAFLSCLGLFTAAFRVAGISARADPWSTPLGSFGLAYALAGVVAGILWRSPGIVLPSLLLSVALGAALSPPLLSLYLPQPSGSGGARLAALLRLGGLTWITGLLAGATAWLLLRRTAPSRASAAGSERTERERSTGPSKWRKVVRARWREIAAGAAVVAVLAIIALELRALWWPGSVPPWSGAQMFADPSLPLCQRT